MIHLQGVSNEQDHWASHITGREILLGVFIVVDTSLNVLLPGENL